MRFVKEILNLCIVDEAGPGNPLSRLERTNGELLRNHGDFVAMCVVERFLMLRDTPHAVLRTKTARQLVQECFTDVVRLFVKQEPHKDTKIIEGRVRLIMNLSLVDQVVERMLCATQNNEEIANWTWCPSKPGLGFADLWQKEALLSDVENTSRESKTKVADSDVSGWDWSVSWQLLEMDAYARAMLVELQPQHRKIYLNLLLNRFYCNALCVYALSNGELLESLEPGIQKSGSYNTSSTNSRMRVILALLVGALWAKAAGDDDVEGAIEDAKEKYAEFGIDLKEYNVHEDGAFEFCSHVFSRVDGRAKARPLNWARDWFRFLHQVEEPAFLQQFCSDLQDDPQSLLRCLEHLSQISWGQQNA